MPERDYGEYKHEITVIKGFEEYEEELNTDFGEHSGDFMPWFLIFRAGFEAGGCN